MFWFSFDAEEELQKWRSWRTNERFEESPNLAGAANWPAGHKINSITNLDLMSGVVITILHLLLFETIKSTVARPSIYLRGDHATNAEIYVINQQRTRNKTIILPHLNTTKTITLLWK